MTFTQLKDLFPQVARKMNVHRQVTAAEVINKFKKFAPVLFQDDEIANELWPKWFKNKVLILGANNPAYAQEVNLLKKDLIEKINADLGGVPVIYDIKTMIGKKRVEI